MSNEIFSKAIDLFDREGYSEAQKIFESLVESSSIGLEEKNDYLFNLASCLASQNKLSDAIEIFSKMMDSKEVSYNLALCNYRLNKYNKAKQLIEESLNLCYLEYPKLKIPSDYDYTLDDNDVSDSHIIEILNLQAAINYKLNEEDQFQVVTKIAKVKESFERIPIRKSENLDSVTIHNQAIYGIENFKTSIDKLEHLITNIADAEFPAQTYRNLMILYLDFNRLESLSEFLKINQASMIEHVDKDELRFFQLACEKPKDLALLRVEKLLDELSTTMRVDIDNKPPIGLIETIVTWLLKQYWSNNQYELIEKLMSKVKPIVGEGKIWKKNMAHTFFMMDTKFEEASQLYEEFLPTNSTDESILDVDPIVLGNLCVSYVLTGRNGEAEAILKEVENEHEAIIDMYLSSQLDSNFLISNGNTISLTINNDTIDSLYQDHLATIDNKQRFASLCAMNIIIGTLYCVKNNYDFGLMRIFKTLEPIKHKLTTQTWYHTKRCILSLLDFHCKQLTHAKDDNFNRIVEFLIQCERYGLFVETRFDLLDSSLNGQNSVTYEARYLRSLVLEIIHD